MSKSYGNVSDPIDIMDQYGTDALRFTLLTGSSPGNDMNLSESRIEYSRNFGNKLWQMARFVWSNLEGYTPRAEPKRHRLDLPGRWILSRLAGLVANVQRLFDTYQYGEAGRQVLDFLWSEFADWYIEISKSALYSQDKEAHAQTLDVLAYVLNASLRLLHPYIPYITEKTWGYLFGSSGPLILAAWPTANPAHVDQAAEAEFAILMDLVRGIRNARAEYKVEPGHKISVMIYPGEHRDLIEQNTNIFARLCNVEEPKFIEERLSAWTDMRSASGAVVYAGEAATIVSGDVTAYLPLAELIDLDAERERLRRELDNLDQQIARAEGLLKNDGFVAKARPDVVQRERDKLEALSASRRAVEERLTGLGG
jgi:valyl-tRNA synthetase